MNRNTIVRDFYVLPCCVLLLNLALGIVSYKAKLIDDLFLRTLAIIAMVLFGGSLVGFVLEPAVRGVVAGLHRRSRRSAGTAGEILFLLALGGVIFWLYYRFYNIGPESILPPALRNGPPPRRY